MTLEQWVHDPFVLGNDSIFKGSWRLQVDVSCKGPQHVREHLLKLETRAKVCALKTKQAALQLAACY